MTPPSTCPNCGSTPKAYQERIDVRVYECGTWIIENSYSKGPHTQKAKTCDDRRTINDATAVIRAFVDGRMNAMEKGRKWLKDNTP